MAIRNVFYVYAKKKVLKAAVAAKIKSNVFFDRHDFTSARRPAYPKDDRVLLSSDIEGTLIPKGRKLRLVDKKTKFLMHNFKNRNGILMLNTSGNYHIAKQAAEQLNLQVPIACNNGTYVKVPGQAKPLVNAPLDPSVIRNIVKLIAHADTRAIPILTGLGKSYYSQQSDLRTRLFQLKEALKFRSGIKTKAGRKYFKAQYNNTYMLRVVPFYSDYRSSKGIGKRIVDMFNSKARKDGKLQKKQAKGLEQKEILDKVGKLLSGDFSFVPEDKREAYMEKFYRDISPEQLKEIQAHIDFAKGDLGLEINRKGFNKATALAAVREHYGVAADRVFAAGDGAADLKMFNALDRPSHAMLMASTKKDVWDKMPEKCEELIKKENTLRMNIKRAELELELRNKILAETKARNEQRDIGNKIDAPDYEKEEADLQKKLSELKFDFEKDGFNAGECRISEISDTVWQPPRLSGKEMISALSKIDENLQKDEARSERIKKLSEGLDKVKKETEKARGIEPGHAHHA